MIDIEFILQGMVLAYASAHPAILDTPASSSLIDVLREVGLFTEAQADTLHVAHADLLQMGLACTLDLRSRIATRTEALDTLCAGCSRSPSISASTLRVGPTARRPWVWMPERGLGVMLYGRQTIRYR